ADIRIDHPSISRQHARLRLGTQPTITNLRARNGTFLRGHPLADDEEAPVGVGAEIELGEGVVRLMPARTQAARAEAEVGADRPGATPAPRADRRTAGSGRALLASPDGWYAPTSPAMRQVLDVIQQVAPSDVSVLILGET